MSESPANLVHVRELPGGSELSLLFRHDLELIERARSIPGRRWDRGSRCWIVPGGEAGIRRVLEVFGVERVTIERDVVSTPAAHARMIEAFDEHLRLHRYSPRTCRAYLMHVRHMLAAAPEEVGLTALREYVRSLANERFSRAYHAQGVSALRLFAAAVLEIPLPQYELVLVRPRGERRLPRVLSVEEIRRLLAAISRPKHRALVAILIGSGLRVSEVVRLRRADVDTARGMLHVRSGKGRKDRYTVYGRATALELHAWVATGDTLHWLFPGPDPKRHLSTRSVQKVLEHAGRRAGIEKRLTPHVLRHTFATQLFESGVDLRVIQELLGHTSPDTTMIYTHVGRTTVARVVSPLDRIHEGEG